MLDEPFSASKLKKQKKLGEEDSQSDGEGLLAKVISSQGEKKGTAAHGEEEEKKEQPQTQVENVEPTSPMLKNKSIPDTKNDEEIAKLLAAQLE